jgi:hypothetical protein
MELTEDYNVNVYVRILNFCKRLKNLSIIEKMSRWVYPYLTLRNSPSTAFSSSTLTHLCINVMALDDCLYLLDGRLIQLTTLIVRIRHIGESSAIVDNMVGFNK